MTTASTIRATIPGRPGYLRKMGKRGWVWKRVLSANARVHWGQRHLCMEKDIFLVKLHMARFAPPVPFQRARVHVELIVKANVRRDADGLMSTLKGVFDGLVHTGIIADDNLDCIGTPTVSVTVDKEHAYAYVVEVQPL